MARRQAHVAGWLQSWLAPALGCTSSMGVPTPAVIPFSKYENWKKAQKSTENSSGRRLKRRGHRVSPTQPASSLAWRHKRDTGVRWTAFQKDCNTSNHTLRNKPDTQFTQRNRNQALLNQRMLSMTYRLRKFPPRQFSSLPRLQDSVGHCTNLLQIALSFRLPVAVYQICYQQLCARAFGSNRGKTPSTILFCFDVKRKKRGGGATTATNRVAPRHS